MHGKTTGIIGTGKIGTAVAQILTGFGCPTLAFDPFPNDTCRSLGVRYVKLDDLLAQSDVITLHCPLTHENEHIINGSAIQKMKPCVMVINTSRGTLLDTVAVIQGLKSGKIGYLGLDVYEEEEQIFFEDRSGLIIPDDVFARLLTFPNVIITGHQAFFTREALLNIAATTIGNVTRFEQGQTLDNQLVG
jgi:D-lactate dehydrogenase